MMEVIYADYKLDSDDMFVVTPEGREYIFLASDGYNEEHIPVTVFDETVNKNYLVRFDE